MNIMMYLHSGCLNRGCEALVRSAAEIVNKHTSLSEPHIYLSSFLPESDVQLPHIEKVIDLRAKPLMAGSMERYIAALKIKLFNDEGYSIRKSHREFIEAIPSTDIFLSIGGDAYCYGEQPIWYELNRTIKRAGKKLVLWGCSIGEEDLSPAKIEDLKLYDLILARESITYETLKRHQLEHVKLVADGAFLMEKEELPLIEGWEEGNVVGLNFSPLVYAKNPKARDAFRALIRHIIKTTKMQIVFTPHVTEPGNNDFELLSIFFDEFKGTNRVLILPPTLNAIQYKGYIARMRFFVGARTHATIAAYSNSVPTLVLGYSVKSKGIAKDLFGEEKLVLGLKEISDREKLKRRFDQMVAEESQIRETLDAVLPQIRQKSAIAGQFLAELLRQP